MLPQLLEFLVMRPQRVCNGMDDALCSNLLQVGVCRR